MKDLNLMSLSMLGALIGTYLIVAAILHIYLALALTTIAKKTKTPNAWLAWIPVANLYLMTQIADVPWWTLLIALIGGLIPFIGILIFAAIGIWWWWKIAEARNKPGWLSLLLLIPLVNLIVIGIIAWND
ncbi:hypothetical protein DRJ22_01040 [Candidatus Woesearchaeota archaeon]|nr:MAG: hypothetical protein B6U93_01680 [Candidatus Woesearchaeota archaeon ex4484_78]RLE46786.1 MAG: hypothetical protein DRJ22_01040 [Candidatus Woesearchaeota archaeon]